MSDGEQKKAKKVLGNGSKDVERAKRRIVFDDPMSGRSRDDSDSGWGGERGEGPRDRDWYLRETPPHHGEK